MSTEMETPLSCFPLAEVRSSQTEALNFLWDAMIEGYEDIVIAAPTGIGKSFIGAAFCLWAGCLEVEDKQPGGYYLVTQKMLQDQLQKDFPSFVSTFANQASSLKSATEYPCTTYNTCGMGSRMTKEKTCPKRREGACPQLIQKWKFDRAKLGVTNYPYFFTEHVYVGKMQPRVALVADECHTLEKQITGFVEICVNEQMLREWAPHLRPVPTLETMQEFTKWLMEAYLPALESRQQMVMENINNSKYKDRKLLDEFNKLDTQMSRTKLACSHMAQDPEAWVYWQEEVKDDLQSTAKPLSAAPFFPKLIKEMAATRLYMSAYPGPKDVFCRNLGLDESKVAWLDLDSNFPVEHRPVHIIDVGSMGRSYIDMNFPSLCHTIENVLKQHGEQKGIIHCHSYHLGNRLHAHLRRTDHGHRILFPSKAAERRTVMAKHRESEEPTVILSPSIAEGFSFDDDLARFQIIAKMPYPYLGDKQVAAKKNQDPEWYVLQTVMTVIQACGRIVRSEKDYGHTYILDSDFTRLFDENRKFFPKWFRDAFQFQK